MNKMLFTYLELLSFESLSLAHTEEFSVSDENAMDKADR
jgi:hypothetical protein